MFIRQNEQTFKLILIINSGSMVAHNVCWWSNASCVVTLATGYCLYWCTSKYLGMVLLFHLDENIPISCFQNDLFSGNTILFLHSTPITASLTLST